MFAIKDVAVLEINGHISVAGKRVGAEVFGIKIGSKLTDGKNLYVVNGIPFVRYSSITAMQENFCVTIERPEEDLSELNGRTLVLASV